MNTYQDKIPYEEDTIDLYELWQTLWSRRKFIIIFVSVSVILTAVISLIMTPVYKSETTVLPVSGKSNMLGGLSDIAAIAGLSVGGGGDDSQKVMAVLNSRTIKENVIKRLDLVKVILEEVPENRDPMQACLEKFEKRVSISSDKKSGVISIAIEDEDPERARKIADVYVSELKDILNSKSLTTNKMKRVFLEKQLRQTEKRLKKDQRVMARYQKKTKMLQPVDQAKGSMALLGELIAQKTKVDVQIKSMEIALSPGSPILKSLQSQRDEIEKKIQSIEGGTSSGALPSLKDAPDRIVTFSEFYRNLEVSKAMYETLLKLYEQARLEEAQESLFVEVVDPPIAPDKRSKPKRALMVIVAGFTSGFLAVFIVFFMEWLRSVRREHGVM